MPQQVYSNNVTIGPKIEVAIRMSSLEFSILNQRVAQHKIGSQLWWSELERGYAKLGFKVEERLARRPKPRRVSSAPRGHDWALKGREKRGQQARRHKPKWSPRVERAVSRLEVCPGKCLFFVTVVSAFGRSVDEAKHLINEEARRLNQYMRRRFKHAKWLLFCEVDEVLAKNVASDILPDPKWKDGIPANTLLYKIHFHGVAYIPGKNAQEVEFGFKRTESGKVSKMYRGNNQVRVIPVRVSEDNGKKIPDVRGVSGYATKFHFRPPVATRMLEGYPEWFDLSQFIARKPESTLIGGFNEDTFEYCFKCKAYFPLDHVCELGCAPRPGEALDVSLLEGGHENTVRDQQYPPAMGHDPDFGLLPESDDTLNSDRATSGQHLTICLEKKRNGMVISLINGVLKLWRNLVPAGGP